MCVLCVGGGGGGLKCQYSGENSFGTGTPNLGKAIILPIGG